MVAICRVVFQKVANEEGQEKSWFSFFPIIKVQGNKPMLAHEYENSLTRMSLNLLVALANIPSATAGEVIPLWNGKYTFSYHQWPTGSKHVHYHDTTNHFDSHSEATMAMSRFVASFNRELGVP